MLKRQIEAVQSCLRRINDLGLTKSFTILEGEDIATLTTLVATLTDALQCEASKTWVSAHLASERTALQTDSEGDGNGVALKSLLSASEVCAQVVCCYEKANALLEMCPIKVNDVDNPRKPFTDSIVNELKRASYVELEKERKLKANTGVGCSVLLIAAAVTAAPSFGGSLAGWALLSAGIYQGVRSKYCKSKEYSQDCLNFAEPLVNKIFNGDNDPFGQDRDDGPVLVKIIKTAVRNLNDNPGLQLCLQESGFAQDTTKKAAARCIRKVCDDQQWPACIREALYLHQLKLFIKELNQSLRAYETLNSISHRSANRRDVIAALNAGIATAIEALTSSHMTVKQVLSTLVNLVDAQKKQAQEEHGNRSSITYIKPISKLSALLGEALDGVDPDNIIRNASNASADTAANTKTL